VTQASPRDLAAASEAAVAAFAKLDVKSIALLLDVDGTIIDLAPTPDGVHVPDDLLHVLGRLLTLTGGALALVSGRPIADLDRLFAPLKPPAVGGHGAETRFGNETISVQALSEGLRSALAAGKNIDPGIIVEDKGYSTALHFRNAPQSEARLREHVATTTAAFPQEAVEVLPGKAVLEVKRAGINKGEAVRSLMRHAPFAGRKPVFVGDDVTDQSVFSVLADLGGTGFSVQRHFAGVSGIFRSPEQVRVALRVLAEHET
jgi:trehalose 6-phosphate phosphatase